jgi:hypothetical protein
MISAKGSHMESDSNQNRATSKPWSFYPLIHLSADWTHDFHDDFELDVRVVRADADVLRTMQGIVQADSPKFPGEYVFEHDVQWLLAIHLGDVEEHVNIYEIGMSFVDRIEETLVETFLACLRMIRQTPVICPVKFYGSLDENSVEIDASFADRLNYNEPDYEAPPVQWPEMFQDADLDVLKDLWRSMVSLRRLAYWIKEPFEEKFFSNLQQKAHARVTEIIERRNPERPKLFAATIVEAIENMGGEVWKSIYGEAFREVFGEEREWVILARTRIGRALMLYNDGLHLSLLHSFLSACLALETLFNIDRGEITHKIATRLAKIAGAATTPEARQKERKDLYDNAKAVYKARSSIVHGSGLIDALDEAVKKDAFRLVRLSLQGILLKPSLLKLYADQATMDKIGRERGKKGKKRKKEKKRKEGSKPATLQDFFEELDLGLEDNLEL